MAGEKDVLLVAEVIVEVALLHLQIGRDLLDGGAVIPEPAERGCGALEDVDARRRARIRVARPAAPARRRAPGPRRLGRG